MPDLPDRRDRFVATHRTSLVAVTERIVALARQLVDAGDGDPDRFQIEELASGLMCDLAAHLDAERRLLPHLGTTGAPCAATRPLQHDHDELTGLIQRLRLIARRYAHDATGHALWQGLVALDATLHRQIDLEREVVAPCPA